MVDILKDIGEFILNTLQSVIFNIVSMCLYALDCAFVSIANLAYKMFRVFAGLEVVTYRDGSFTNKDALINVLLRNGTITTVYWYLAIIGFVLCLAFAIVAVVRKIADLEDRQQQSIGHILFNVGKSIVTMLLMTAIVTVVINFSNVLLSSVDEAFSRANVGEMETSIDFNEEEYAAMARVLNTIGNYSLNTAYSSRYNVNACYNNIRADMQWLEEDGIFEYDYSVTDSSERPVESWQSALLRIYKASGDLRRDISMDYYDENLARAIISVMETIQTNDSFRPLTHFERKGNYVEASNIPFDVILFMTGTGQAAHTEKYNEQPAINDMLRGQYLNGKKSIYDLYEVLEDFSILPFGSPRMQHVIILLAAYFMFRNLMVCVFNAVARVFNVIMLYLISPLAISVTPLDDGGKFKQWKTAFIIQCFGLLGNVIAMRLFLLFIPLVLNGQITFFDDGFLNLLAQVVMIYAGSEVTKKASGIITGILADNAGMQAVMAGDMSDTANGAVSATAGFVGGVTGLSELGHNIGRSWNNLSERGGIGGYIAHKASGGSLGKTHEEEELAKRDKHEDAREQKRQSASGQKDGDNGAAGGSNKSGDGEIDGGGSGREGGDNNAGTGEANKLDAGVVNLGDEGADDFGPEKPGVEASGEANELDAGVVNLGDEGADDFGPEKPGVEASGEANELDAGVVNLGDEGVDDFGPEKPGVEASGKANNNPQGGGNNNPANRDGNKNPVNRGEIQNPVMQGNNLRRQENQNVGQPNPQPEQHDRQEKPQANLQVQQPGQPDQQENPQQAPQHAPRVRRQQVQQPGLHENPPINEQAEKQNPAPGVNLGNQGGEDVQPVNKNQVVPVNNDNAQQFNQQPPRQEESPQQQMQNLLQQQNAMKAELQQLQQQPNGEQLQVVNRKNMRDNNM